MKNLAAFLSNIKYQTKYNDKYDKTKVKISQFTQNESEAKFVNIELPDVYSKFI